MILDLLNSETAEYKKLYPSIEELPDAWNVYRGYNIQKYDPGGGFKEWHCETGDFKTIQLVKLSRMLVWMIYLNDVPDGGTDFREQNWTCEAKRGRLVIYGQHLGLIIRVILVQLQQNILQLVGILLICHR